MWTLLVLWLTGWRRSRALPPPGVVAGPVPAQPAVLHGVRAAGALSRATPHHAYVAPSNVLLIFRVELF